MRIPLAQSASIVRAVPEQVQADEGLALAAELGLKAQRFSALALRRAVHQLRCYAETTRDGRDALRVGRSRLGR
jgi:hypothetical protein